MLNTLVGYLVKFALNLVEIPAGKRSVKIDLMHNHP